MYVYSLTFFDVHSGPGYVRLAPLLSDQSCHSAMSNSVSAIPLFHRFDEVLKALTARELANFRCAGMLAKSMVDKAVKTRWERIKSKYFTSAHLKASCDTVKTDCFSQLRHLHKFSRGTHIFLLGRSTLVLETCLCCTGVSESMWDDPCKWEQLLASCDRNDSSVAVHEGEVFILGGSNGYSQDVATLERLDPCLPEWKRVQQTHPRKALV